MAAEIKIDNEQDSAETKTDSKKSSKKETEKKGASKALSALEKLEKELEAKEQEGKESYDRFLRVSAEFENYKKRSAREMADFKKFANEALIKELLSVVDNLERALDSSKTDPESEKKVLEGVQMTLQEILKILEKFGVKAIEAHEQPFDPTFHQAVMQEESKDSPSQTVIKELQKGYTIHDRLLRPSMVVVST